MTFSLSKILWYYFAVGNYVAHKRLPNRLLVTENKYRKLVFKIFAVTQIQCYVGGVWDRGSGGVFSVQGDYVGSLVAILAQPRVWV